MLVQILTATIAEMNAGTETEKPITDVTLVKPDGVTNKQYRPTKIEMTNDTGADVEIGLFTAFEYEEYQADSNISDLWPVPDGTSFSKDNMAGEITMIIVKGAGSGHTGNLTMFITQE